MLNGYILKGNPCILDMGVNWYRLEKEEPKACRGRQLASQIIWQTINDENAPELRMAA